MWPDTRRLPLLLVLLSSGCWLSGEEWRLKREEAALNGQPTPTEEPVVPDLGLGTCVEALFDGQASGILDGGPSDLTPDGTCAGQSGEEVAFAWSVPDAGCYVLDGTGSDMEVAVYGRESCTGAMAFCGAGVPAIAELDEEPVLLVVDVLDGSTTGEWKVEAVDLITHDIGTNTQLDGDLTTRPTWETFACEGVPSGAAAYVRFTPVTGGTWAFDVVAPFETSVSLHQACDLESTLDCSDSAVDGHTVARTELGPLEEVVVRIAGRWPEGEEGPERGSWSLYITEE